MTAPGWYPDQQGSQRYWDGNAWTDQTKAKGLPIWAVVVSWVVSALGAFVCWWFVLLMVTFGCDSGWEGCENVGGAAVILYAVAVGVGLLGLLVWALLKPTPTVKAVAFFLMPVWVIVAVVITFAAYFFMAQGALSP